MKKRGKSEIVIFTDHNKKINYYLTLNYLSIKILI